MVEHTEKTQPDGFSVGWLALRESADHRSRSAQLTQQLADWTKQFISLNVIELGTGTGSNVRYLCPLLGHNQHWTLYDNDVALLQSLPHHLSVWSEQHNAGLQQDGDALHIATDTFSAHIQWRHADLSNSLDSLPLADTHLVTGSALLDLTSSSWLDLLASACIEHQCASMFALNYNGTVSWHEPIPEDIEVTTLLNAHQLKDKGFGPALGPGAFAFFKDRLAQHQQVFTDDSPWILDHKDLNLQQALIDGWAPAATEQNPQASETIAYWEKQRAEAILKKQSSLQVGHVDVLSLPST